jgi:ankyrin repeat protein
LSKLSVLIKEGRPLNERSHTKFGWTPLIAAIYQNNTNVVELLIKAGADVNVADKDGTTPLMWAIGKGDQGVGLVRTLINHGADVFAKDSRGVTVYSYASSEPPKPRILEVLRAATQEQEIKKQEY